MLKGGLVLIWGLDMNLEPTLLYRGDRAGCAGCAFALPIFYPSVKKM